MVARFLSFFTVGFQWNVGDMLEASFFFCGIVDDDAIYRYGEGFFVVTFMVIGSEGNSNSTSREILQRLVRLFVDHRLIVFIDTQN